MAGACAFAHGAVKLLELSGYYTQGRQYDVLWVDGPEPNEPLEPHITIHQHVEGVAYSFTCFDNVTNQPADIYAITGGPALYGVVQSKVAPADGVASALRTCGARAGIHAQIHSDAAAVGRSSTCVGYGRF